MSMKADRIPSSRLASWSWTNAYLRKLTRTMLTSIGARAVYEAADGLAALEIVRTMSPDILLLDWQLPVLSGPQIMRIVRSPDVFSKPILPIIMLMSHAGPLRSTKRCCWACMSSW